MKKFRSIALLLGCLLLPCALLFVAGARYQTADLNIANSRIAHLRVGDNANATELDGMWAGTVQVDNGSTTASLSLTGVTATDYALATATSGNTNDRAILAAPGTDNVLITLSGDPGADTDVSVLVIRVE